LEPEAEEIKRREFNPDIEPPELRTVYALQGVTISTPANLMAITAQAKGGKTAALGAMIASTFPHIPTADLLGFASKNPKNLGVVSFDSEQSPDDFWFCCNRPTKRAGLAQKPEWFRAFTISGLGCRQAREFVTETLKMVADEHGGLHSIIIDGIADLATDPNDAEESNALVAEYHGTAIHYDCPIIGVIHLNPGTEKSRGHLGSQLERKAETNLCLEKDAEEITTSDATKNRRAGIPKSKGPRFCFRTEAGMHVSVESKADAKENEDRQVLSDVVETLFSERPSMSRKDLELNLQKRLKCSPSTAYRNAGQLLQFGFIKKSVAGLYVRANQLGI
jgi:hypothetical protein